MVAMQSIAFPGGWYFSNLFEECWLSGKSKSLADTSAGCSTTPKQFKIATENPFLCLTLIRQGQVLPWLASHDPPVYGFRTLLPWLFRRSEPVYPRQCTQVIPVFHCHLQEFLLNNAILVPGFGKKSPENSSHWCSKR